MVWAHFGLLQTKWRTSSISIVRLPSSSVHWILRKRWLWTEVERRPQHEQLALVPVVWAFSVTRDSLLVIPSSEICQRRHFSFTRDFIWPITCESPDFFVPLRSVDGRFLLLFCTYKDTKKYAHLQLFKVN